jgi:oligoendopeptidase F
MANPPVVPEALPTRDQVPPSDTWDLSSLYSDVAAWDRDLSALQQRIPEFESYRGRLTESPEVLLQFLEFDTATDRLSERVGTYAFLRTTEDQANSDAQAMYARYQSVAVKLASAASFARPELLAMPADKMQQWLEDKRLASFRRVLEQIVRYRPHTLGDKEEQLLAMQGEMAQAANNAFRQLLDADLKFGLITDSRGRQQELTNANFIQLLHEPDRTVRATAFRQYYSQFKAHENTLAATLAGSIHRDVYYARVRGYDSSLAAALFPDHVPAAVYHNLIAAVRSQLPAVHHFYDVRRRKMGLDQIHHYDTYVPILSSLEKHHTWDEAVETVLASLQPLGSEYTGALADGLRGRWCDRYPNRGKQSGAFSCGSFDGDPYILMNYRPDVLNDVFTLAHEAGHSMHSFYAAATQPFQYYNYSIFVAEVASTFNEQLLTDYLLEHAVDDRERAYLINQELDSIRATIVRQTMFAEFELQTHTMAEAGEPLTVASLQDVYRRLLKDYFGPDFQIDPELSLECFRIPHFYRAFYVYKYATGLSAAIALSQRVLQGGPAALADYVQFLRGGCSQDPLDLLRNAGVDMEQPAPVAAALKRFGDLVTELDRLL